MSTTTQSPVQSPNIGFSTVPSAPLPALKDDYKIVMVCGQYEFDITLKAPESAKMKKIWERARGMAEGDASLRGLVDGELQSLTISMNGDRKIRYKCGDGTYSVGRSYNDEQLKKKDERVAEIDRGIETVDATIKQLSEQHEEVKEQFSEIVEGLEGRRNQLTRRISDVVTSGHFDDLNELKTVKAVTEESIDEEKALFSQSEKKYSEELTQLQNRKAVLQKEKSGLEIDERRALFREIDEIVKTVSERLSTPADEEGTIGASGTKQPFARTDLLQKHYEKRNSPKKYLDQDFGKMYDFLGGGDRAKNALHGIVRATAFVEILKSKIDEEIKKIESLPGTAQSDVENKKRKIMKLRMFRNNLSRLNYDALYGAVGIRQANLGKEPSDQEKEISGWMNRAFQDAPAVKTVQEKSSRKIFAEETADLIYVEHDRLADRIDNAMDRSMTTPCYERFVYHASSVGGDDEEIAKAALLGVGESDPELVTLVQESRAEVHLSQDLAIFHKVLSEYESDDEVADYKVWLGVLYDQDGIKEFFTT